MEKIDCTTCKYGRYNDHWGMSFCYNTEDCKGWGKYQPIRKDETIGKD